jgi:hypothetical protein
MLAIDVTKFTVLVLFLITFAAGCDLSELGGTEDDAGFPTTVDEAGGRYGEVSFGSAEEEVRAAFGEPGGREGYFPLDEDFFRGPVFIRAVGGKPAVLRYEEAAFLVSPTAGVYSFVVTRLGAKTRAGVMVGDPLSQVRERYEGVSCGEAVAGEALFGGEQPTYPWCRARVSGAEVFFGDDPIEAITVTARPAR